MKPTKKERKILNTILLVIGITTVVFMAAMVWLFVRYQAIPDTLVERYFTCVVGELGVMGVIQVAKSLVAWKRGREENRG